ncbi:15600_t:CDS:2, partial [Funneliformis geosporum]
EFTEAITYLGASNYITHTLKNIDDVFEKIDKDEFLETNEKKIDSTTTMKIYWHTEEGDTLISAIFDPRIKSLTFINKQDLKDQAKTLLQNKYNVFKEETISPILPEIRSELLRSSFYQTSLFSIFEKQLTQQ